MTKTISNRQRHNQFSRGRGVFACETCGHNTRGTADSADSRCCQPCYELAGYENSCSDDGPERFTDGMFADVERQLAVIAERGGDAKRAADDWSGLYAALAAWQAKRGTAAPVEAAPVAAAPAPVAKGTLLNLCYNAKGDVTLYVNGKKVARGTEHGIKAIAAGYSDGRWGVVYDNRKK